MRGCRLPSIFKQYASHGLGPGGQHEDAAGPEMQVDLRMQDGRLMEDLRMAVDMRVQFVRSRIPAHDLELPIRVLVSDPAERVDE